jgi:hypothetical protein
MVEKRAKEDPFNVGRRLGENEHRVMLAALERYVLVTHQDNESSASRSLGITMQVINRARHNRRIGLGLAHALARELGSSIEQMTAAAHDAWPNRTLAVPLAKEHGVSEEGIMRVLALPHTRDGDVSRVAWVLRMVEADGQKKP